MIFVLVLCVVIRSPAGQRRYHGNVGNEAQLPFRSHKKSFSETPESHSDVGAEYQTSCL